MPWALLGPVQRVGELAGAVKADVKGLWRAGAVGSSRVLAVDEIDLLAAGRLRGLLLDLGVVL